MIRPTNPKSRPRTDVGSNKQTESSKLTLQLLQARHLKILCGEVPDVGFKLCGVVTDIFGEGGAVRGEFGSRPVVFEVEREDVKSVWELDRLLVMRRWR